MMLACNTETVEAYSVLAEFIALDLLEKVMEALYVQLEISFFPVVCRAWQD